MIRLIKNTRFWLMLYLFMQTLLYWKYSFRVLKDFQQLYSSIFFVIMLVVADLVREKYLLYVAILAALFCDPLYTFSILTLNTSYKIVITIAFISLIIYKRKELRFIMIILFVANAGLFISQI